MTAVQIRGQAWFTMIGWGNKTSLLAARWFGFEIAKCFTQSISSLGLHYGNTRLDGGYAGSFAKNIEGGRSWLIVLHHHCRNSSRLTYLFKSNIRTLQEQSYICSVFILFSGCVLSFIKLGLTKFIQKTPQGRRLTLCLTKYIWSWI